MIGPVEKVIGFLDYMNAEKYKTYTTKFKYIVARYSTRLYKSINISAL